MKMSSLKTLTILDGHCRWLDEFSAFFEKLSHLPVLERLHFSLSSSYRQLVSTQLRGIFLFHYPCMVIYTAQHSARNTSLLGCSGWRS